ncbi:MAG: hypothetical protein JRH20_09100 [Deltaproteobacteria bacterium]|nr:hypothetical protein [Deltaproteobacteria bacterium]
MSETLALLRRRFAETGETLVPRWLEALSLRSWPLRGDERLRAQLEGRAKGVFLALQRSLDNAEVLALGSPSFKEPIALLSFLGGWMAGVGMSAGAAVALCHALQDVIGSGAGRFFESLVVVMAEAHAAGISQSAQARHRQVIEKSQVVAMLSDELAVLFLVGDPDREALDDAIGRLMMLAFQRQARSIILDASGLSERQVLSTAVGFLGEHREVLGECRLLLSAVSPAEAQQLGKDARLPLEGFDRLEFALASAPPSSKPVSSKLGTD